MLAQRTRVYAAEAITLKRMDFGEVDRIITVFTPEHGKMRLLAKGVRRSTSRMAGHLELFAHSHVMIARGRDLHLTTQASTIEPFREVREDLQKSSYAYHLAELVDAFLQDWDPHRGVFILLRDALAALAEVVIAADVIARHFELHLLDAVGFRPQLTSCLSCATEIRPGDNGYSVALGGIFCPQCAAQEPSTSPIADDTLKVLRYLQRTQSVRGITIRTPAAVSLDSERWLRRHLEFVLERRLRAVEFVRHVAETLNGYRT
ncbi:MAG: DNA repair protein RecO [Chloroflexi bacterium]|nr:DNA repair protein RecO [Chloroflexota bacterium]